MPLSALSERWSIPLTTSCPLAPHVRVTPQHTSVSIVSSNASQMTNAVLFPLLPRLLLAFAILGLSAATISIYGSEGIDDQPGEAIL